MSLPVVRASVRQVVETTYHDSDLSPAAGAQKRMREGADDGLTYAERIA